MGAGMGDDVAAILLILSIENAELRQQLAAAEDMLVESAIDTGYMNASVEALQAERDAWLAEAERRGTR